MEKNGLTVSNITFSYSRGKCPKKVLDQISFKVTKGVFCTLLGANGAGKSTLLKCLNGLIVPKSGTVFWNNENIASWSLKKRASVFGYVPQTLSVSSGLSVMDTVLSGSTHSYEKRKSSSEIDQVSQILEDFGLSDLAFRNIRELSGGERQRVLFCRALAQKPEVLLLDEPTSNLDLKYQIETMKLLKKLSTQYGMTIIAIIHDLNSALTYADQFIMMKKGRVLADGKKEDVITEKIIEDAYGVKTEIIDLSGRKIILAY